MDSRSETTPQDGIFNQMLDTGIYSCLQGTVDIQCHTHPDFCPRLLDDYEVIRLAKAVGMRAVLLKNHAAPNSDRAYIAEKAVGGGIRVCSVISLNPTIGGINPVAVSMAIKNGISAVWMPSMWADNHVQYVRASAKKMGYETLGMQFPEKGVTILEADGRVKDDLLHILDMVAEADIMLASGHLYVEEVHKLLEAATERGITKKVIHTANYHVMAYPKTDLVEFVEKYGAALEFGFTSLPNGVWDPVDRNRQVTLDDVCDLIRTVGAENCLVSTDTGQFTSPIPIECMRMWVEILKSKKFTTDEIDQMTKHVPARVVGLPPLETA